MVTLIPDWRAAAAIADVFWSCDDGAERLSHNDLGDAVEEYVDGFNSPNCDVEKILREEVSPLVIYGYTRAEVTDRHLADFANDLADHLAESLDEDEFGDPFDDHQVLAEDDKKAIAERFCTVLREERARFVPWACEVTMRVVVEGDELVRMVREICPYWFDTEPVTAPGR